MEKDTRRAHLHLHNSLAGNVFRGEFKQSSAFQLWAVELAVTNGTSKEIVFSPSDFQMRINDTPLQAHVAQSEDFVELRRGYWDRVWGRDLPGTQTMSPANVFESIGGVLIGVVLLPLSVPVAAFYNIRDDKHVESYQFDWGPIAAGEIRHGLVFFYYPEPDGKIFEWEDVNSPANWSMHVANEDTFGALRWVLEFCH